MVHVDRGRSSSRSVYNSTAPTSAQRSEPIHIPAARRSKLFGSAANGNCVPGASPVETIFAMSPLTSEGFVDHEFLSAASLDPSSESSSSTSLSPHETRPKPPKFMYSIPNYSNQNRAPMSGAEYRIPTPADRTGASSTTGNSVLDSTRYRAGVDTLHRRGSPPQLKPSCVLDEYDLSPCSLSPMKENFNFNLKCTPQQQQQQRASRPERLSPRTQDTFYNSPWILYGRGQKQQQRPSEDHAAGAAHSHMDSTSLEFKRHLFKRIDSRNPSRLINTRYSQTQ